MTAVNFNVSAMRALMKQDRYLKMMYELQMKKGRQEEETFELLFWAHIFDDSVYTERYKECMKGEECHGEAPTYTCPREQFWEEASLDATIYT